MPDALQSAVPRRVASSGCHQASRGRARSIIPSTTLDIYKPGTRHPATANTLLLDQHRSLAVRRSNVDIFPSEVRPLLGLGIWSGLERRPNVISEARRTPAEARSQLNMFQPWRPDGSPWRVTLKATGYSNTYKHRKSRQISRSRRMIEGPRGIMKALS